MEAPRRAPILSLLFGCGPSAVLRPVVSIVVGIAVERVFGGGPLAHISVEIFEFLPALANGDAAPAIFLVIVALWVAAPIDHVAPSSVFNITVKAMLIISHCYFPAAIRIVASLILVAS